MTATRRRAGRPRSAASEQAILGATLELLATDGFDGASTDAIAARAGVSKATIYRRWSSKDELVLAAIAALARDVPDPDLGSLRRDLDALIGGLRHAFADPRLARLIPTLVDQMARKPAFAAAMRDGFIRPRREVARRIIARAQQRGEIAVSDSDTDVALDMIGAPFYYRIMLTGDPIDDTLARNVADAVHAWLHRPSSHA